MARRSGPCGYFSLGSMLREARHKRNLHPSAVANKLGCKDCRILERIENGEIKVPLTNLSILAKTLNLPLNVLFEVATGYHPGLEEKAREIGQSMFDVELDDQLLVAIILCALDKRQEQESLH